jgi:nucleoside-diphosphate-sugar epimerase
MRVLVTGAQGYIGVHLASALLARGHEVVGVDTGYYADRQLYDGGLRRPPVLARDIRRLTLDDVRGFDACAHLAELSNDPLGQMNRALTFEINHAGSVRLAQLCKAAGVSRFVYTSSCSVYGVGSDDVKTEESAPNPQTAYAECKVLVERDVGALADARFSPTFLRNATAYGASPSMRFDLVLNNLAGLAWTTGVIAMTSDGTPWRPLIHVQDICRAIICALEAPREAVHNEIFNVGDDTANYRIREIAEIVGSVFEGCGLTFGAPGGDNRSYRVAFDKIHARLPGFSCGWNALAGTRELRELFGRLPLTPEEFAAPTFTRVRQLTRLVEAGRLDERFFWVERSAIQGAEPEATRGSRSS